MAQPLPDVPLIMPEGYVNPFDPEAFAKAWYEDHPEALKKTISGLYSAEAKHGYKVVEDD